MKKEIMIKKLSMSIDNELLLGSLSDLNKYTRFLKGTSAIEGFIN